MESCDEMLNAGAAMQSNRPKIHVYFHVAMMGSFWRETLCELCGEVAGSQLYDVADTLTACRVGEGTAKKTPLHGSKWKSRYGGEIARFEYPTLELLWEHACREPDAVFLYFHTKGVRDEVHRTFRAGWRRIMSQQLIARWCDCLEKFDEGYQAIGSLYSSWPFPHYAGNFWWAHGSHLSTLPKPAPIEEGINKRVWAEMWLMHKLPRPVIFDWGTPTDMMQHLSTGKYRERPVGHGVRASSMSNPQNFPWLGVGPDMKPFEP